MKEFRLNQEKNEFLKLRRGISFENIIKIIKNDRQVEVIEHPNKQKLPTQRIFLVHLKNYVYMVPFIKNKIIKYEK